MDFFVCGNLQPSQQYFSHVGRIFCCLGLNLLHIKQQIKCLFINTTQQSDTVGRVSNQQPFRFHKKCRVLASPTNPTFLGLQFGTHPAIIHCSHLLLKCRVATNTRHWLKVQLSRWLKNCIYHLGQCQNSLDPDQTLCFVGPDMGPNCLQRLSTDLTKVAPCMQRVKYKQFVNTTFWLKPWLKLISAFSILLKCLLQHILSR